MCLWCRLNQITNQWKTTRSRESIVERKFTSRLKSKFLISFLISFSNVLSLSVCVIYSGLKGIHRKREQVSEKWFQTLWKPLKFHFVAALNLYDYENTEQNDIEDVYEDTNLEDILSLYRVFGKLNHHPKHFERLRRGISDECCKNPCNIRILSQYCQRRN